MTYEIEDKDIEQLDMLIEYYNNIRAEEGFKSVWSMWTTSEWPGMEDNSGIPEGTVIRYWNTRGEDIKVQVNGKTWLDVWKACDKAIIESGTHHIFIEGLIWTTIEKDDGTFEKFLDLFTGS